MDAPRFMTITISPDCAIEKAIRLIDESGMETALVADKDLRLLGTVTDGDVRRAIIRGVPLQAPVHEIMNTRCTVLPVGISHREALRVMKDRSIRQIPLVDAQGRIRDLLLQKDLLKEQERPNWVVIMAGGLGKRLQPFTEEVPKPMLHVGGQPLLQTLIEQLAERGLRNILVSLNYKSNVIERYFGDGSFFGVNLRYVREERSLGTAGALKLASEHLKQTFLVLNGDILTTVNFAHLLDYHREHAFKVTLGMKQYEFFVPYGVLDLNDLRIERIREKPAVDFFISAGIYCMEPDVLDFIPESEPYDIPQLINRLLEAGHAIGGFPIREYWLDIGHPEDYVRANIDIAGIKDVREA